MTAERVPELSLADYLHGTASSRDAFCAQLMQGLQRFGFIILHDHDVPAALLDDAYALSTALFALPEETKRRYIGGPRGYAPFRTEHARNHAAADLKEFWQIGPDRFESAPDDPTSRPNVWPDAPPRFRETFTALYDALEDTGRVVLEALAPGLGLLPGFFEPLVLGGTSILRLIHYPPVPHDIEPGSVRSAPHEDINLITLLVAARGPGLELLDRDGCWLPVGAHDEGRHEALIVDAGDMLARMTNDVIPATTHRVVNPSGANVSRYSMPFFMHPRPEVSLGCLPTCVGTGARYPEITAGMFLEQRLREIGLLKSQ